MISAWMKGEPTAVANTPVPLSIVYSYTKEDFIPTDTAVYADTYRNRPVGSMANDTGLFPVTKGDPGKGVRMPVEAPTENPVMSLEDEFAT
jgi:hypothetical protein